MFATLISTSPWYYGRGYFIEEIAVLYTKEFDRIEIKGYYKSYFSLFITYGY